MNAQDAYDALLAWCSETGSGTIEEFRRSCRHLELPPSRCARVLSELGHVEFDWEHGRYAAAPATLTTIPGLPGRLLLTGARPYGLIADLARAAAASPLDAEVSRDLCHQFGRGPSTSFIDADPADGPALCEQVEIRFAPKASEQLARSLPQIRLDSFSVAHRPDSRFPHALVDPHTFQPRWDEPVADGELGLWLYRTWGRRRRMILRTEEGEPRMVLDPDGAPYLMPRPADADPIIEYVRAHHLLKVNAAAPLPALHARCACLCSGRVPLRRDIAPGIAYDHYVNVAPQVAAEILHSLGAT